MNSCVKLCEVTGNITAVLVEDECVSYILRGSECAAVIDTCGGTDNFYNIVRSVTQLPLIVINTHGHGDHIGGNMYFSEAYINQRDKEMYCGYFNDPEVEAEIKEKGLAPCKALDIEDGDVFDLGGGVILEVVAVPGHTAGSICLLDREDRILFTGDSVNDMLWMQLDESLPISTLITSLSVLESRRDAFDYLLTGHWQWRTQGLTDADMLGELIGGAKALAAGDTQNDLPYEWFGGIAKEHFYAEERRIIYTDEKLSG